MPKMKTKSALRKRIKVTGTGKVKREMATHFSILSWKISWTEEPSTLQFMGLLKSWI